MAVQPPNRTIFLVGMMGAGKSTIGKALAALMGTKFVDLDRELEERCGVSIPHIFETEGEAGFRCRETRLLQEYAKASDMVVATGGGVVTREENREILKASPAVAVHLKVSPEECFRRTQGTDRPLLQCADPMEKICRLLQERGPLYEEVADISYETDGMKAARAAQELLNSIQQHKLFKEQESNTNKSMSPPTPTPLISGPA